MKLIRARVQNYRSVEDSEEFEVGDMTCLVGKNEAGKTTILNALRGLRPSQPFKFDTTMDYPRRFAMRFKERHPDGEAEVIRAWWRLDEADCKLIEDRFGAGVLMSDTLQTSFGFNFVARSRWTFQLDQVKCLGNLVTRHKLNKAERQGLDGVADGADAVEVLGAIVDPSPSQAALLEDLKKCRGSDFELEAIDLLKERMPKFFYTSHFERMSGEISVEQLRADKAADNVSVGDQIFLDFLEYAGTTLDELAETNQREELKARCEAAGNDITDEIFQFWSQNNALEVVIDLTTGKPGDKAPFNAGTVAQIRIKNNNHKATLPLSERSAGFVWFFSFLAQFKQLKKTNGNAIILLDEPGLTLHGKAQGDLLRYIVERLLPEHQVIFTTHSPFMVPMKRLADVRIVEDVVEAGAGRPVVKGTKVRSDVLAVGEDALFPLQAALGYEVTQSLFVGANTLLVEGPADIIFLDVLSQALRFRGREGLSAKWTVCPCGGIDKIATFGRLFGGNKINLAVLSDKGKGDGAKIESLKKADILKAGHFQTIADFVDQPEADVEDIFSPALFVAMLNGGFKVPAAFSVTVASLAAADERTVRSVKQAEALFKLMPPEVVEFDHFGAARWLLSNPGILDGEAPEVLATLATAERIFKYYNELLPN